MDGNPLQRCVPLNDMHVEHDDVSNEGNDGNVTNEVNATSTSMKRRYTFINRSPKQRPQPNFAFYVSCESAQRISCIDCCAKKCH